MIWQTWEESEEKWTWKRGTDNQTRQDEWEEAKTGEFAEWAAEFTHKCFALVCDIAVVQPKHTCAFVYSPPLVVIFVSMPSAFSFECEFGSGQMVSKDSLLVT